jgi:hypothetical protein
VSREIRRVPPGFKHPVDEDGEFIAGGHLEPLYYADPATLTSYQVYENVSEGSPVSPVFDTTEDLLRWLEQEGWPQEAIDSLLDAKHAPSFVIPGQRGSA